MREGGRTTETGDKNYLKTDIETERHWHR